MLLIIVLSVLLEELTHQNVQLLHKNQALLELNIFQLDQLKLLTVLSLVKLVNNMLISVLLVLKIDLMLHNVYVMMDIMKNQLL
jgi:hypothetical protein